MLYLSAILSAIARRAKAEARRAKAEGGNRRLNVMGCDIWEVVVRKKTSSIHQRGNLCRWQEKSKAIIYHEGLKARRGIVPPEAALAVSLLLRSSL